MSGTSARAGRVLPPSPSPSLADTTAEAVLAGILAEVGAPTTEQRGPHLVVDGRWPLISAETLRRVVASGPGAVLLSATGQAVARVVVGEDPLPDEVDGLLTPASASDTIALPPTEDVPLGPEALDRIERALMDRRLAELARSGVRVIGAERVWIGLSVTVAPGAVLWPDIVLKGGTTIGEQAEIRPGCWVEDTAVGARSVLLPHTVANGARIGEDCAVGPMAHLREGTVLERQVKVGNFVEVKKSTLHEGAKASHLTYLGDASVGRKANVGAGTITCNYDGFGKHRTVIGDGAFVGSNTALVAPVSVGAGAIVGAGSVITQDVPDEALAFERAPQTVLEGKAPRIRERNRERAKVARAARENPGG